MKKLSKIYLGILSALLLLTACNKQLDLKPYQSIDQSVAILTAQDVQITLVGAYNRASLSDLYGGGAFIYPDMLASQTLYTWQGTFQTQTQMVDQAIAIDNASVNATWLAGYQVINQANNVLANISKVEPDDKNRTQGEAEFLRGLTYFDLVRLFGRDWNDGTPSTNPGVPIVLTPTTSITAASYVSRASVSQVYAQAIADLKDAKAKLPTSNSFFANSYSAGAILARLYLQQGDYKNAAAEADTVIRSGAFQLNGNYADEFPYPAQTHVDNTQEDVFAIQFTPQTENAFEFNTLNEFYASSDNAGRGDIIIDDSFVNGFEAGDARLSMYNDDSAGLLRVDKFDNVDGNVHVIRLAELYLIRAEANLRLGGAPVGDTPLNDINVIRTRAQLAPLTVATIPAVMTERVHELAFEGGFFLYDAKRTSTAAKQVLVAGAPAFSSKLVFPIPSVEINANSKLVQNPGY